MHRRAFLAALSSGIATTAGCSAFGDTGGATTETLTPVDVPGTDTPAGGPDDANGDRRGERDGNGGGNDGDRGFPDGERVVDLETVPRTYALAPTHYRSADGADVRMAFVATATGEHPALVRAALRNANPFENTFRLPRTPPFGRLASALPHRPWADPRDPWRTRDRRGRESELVFAPTGNHELVDEPPPVGRAEDGCWRLADRIGGHLPETVRLAPDETVQGEYAVVGRAGNAGGAPRPGIYEFRRGHDRSVRLSVWATERPGPEGQSRFAGESVPTLPEGGGVAWYHEADPSVPTYVRPSRERATLPAEVSFTFVNHTREGLGCGGWGLHKLHDGEWFYLGPYFQHALCRMLPPGGTDTWTLHAFPGESVPCRGADEYGHLGGGRYAAVVEYGRAAGASGALFELVGEPVTIVPTDATAEREGARAVVTTDRWNDGRDPSSATLTATPAGGADETLVPEQVMRPRYRALRNALAAFEPGVEEVVVRTDEHAVDRVVGHDADARRVGVDGRAYEVRVDREAEP